MSAPSWQAEAEELRKLAPRHVLFLCVANSARSQLAERVHARRAGASDRARSEEGQLQAFRNVRDELRRRLTIVFGR